MSGRNRTRPPLDGITKMYISYFFMEPRTSESTMRLTIHTDYTLRALMQPAFAREHLATMADAATHAPNAFQAIPDNCAVIALARPEQPAGSGLGPSAGRRPVGSTRGQVSESTCRSRGEAMLPIAPTKIRHPPAIRQ